MSQKSRLQVLCVTMNQEDLSLAEKMNISSDVIFANQTRITGYVEEHHSWGIVKMVSTGTRGVGRNRNQAFIYADGEILLLSDDDMYYTDTYADDIVNEFDSHPDADVIIFNITTTDPKRQQKQNTSTGRMNLFSRLPYGAPRIAIRKKAWEKSNVWFTTLFGGGAKYTNGEDSMFLADLRKAGLRMYVSNRCIGTVDMSNSSWFEGANEQFYFNKGALCAATFSATKWLRMIYYSIRICSKLSIGERIAWYYRGMKAYSQGCSYSEYIK